MLPEVASTMGIGTILDARRIFLQAFGAKKAEAVQAAVVVSADTNEDAIRAYCGEHLAGFKVPDRVYIIDTMPRTATGKIQRRHIAAMFAD